MPCQSLDSWFDHPNNIWWEVQNIKLLLVQSSPLPCYLVPLTLKYLPQNPILRHPQPTFLSQCERPSFTLIQKNKQIYSTVTLMFIFLDSKLEDKRFCNEWQQALRDFSLLFISLSMELRFLGLFTNIWIILPHQRIYYLNLCYDFFLHSDLETWPCTSFH